MIQSMTGFAIKNATLTSLTGKKSTISLSLKSLNGRFFELNCKLPLAFSYLETTMLKMLKNKLIRGHVSLTGYLSNADIVQGAIEPSLNTVGNYISAIEKIKQEHRIEQNITLDHLLRLPNIFNIQEQVTDEAVERTILALINELADAVVQARIAEGAGIGQDIQKRLHNLHTCIDIIKIEVKEFIERTKDKVQQVLMETKPDQAETNDIQKNALLALLDKIDIHEEISRVKSHLNDMEQQLSKPSIEKGKLFDFILQELMRETNTINAKCGADATIVKHAIDAKVEIEKIREQIQNIV